MKSKQKNKLPWILLAVVVLGAVGAFVTASVRNVKAMDGYEVDDENNLLVFFTDKWSTSSGPAEPNAKYTYSTHDYWLHPEAAGGLRNKISSFNAGGYNAVPVGRDGASSGQPDANLHVTVTKRTSVENLIAAMKSWWKEDWRSYAITGFDAYVSRSVWVYDAKQREKGPYYNYPELSDAAQDLWDGHWSTKTLQAFETFYDRKMHLEFKYTTFSIKAIENATGNTLDGSGIESLYGAFEGIVNNNVLIGETLPSVTVPEIKGYDYLGYSFQNESGTMSLPLQSGGKTIPATKLVSGNTVGTTSVHADVYGNTVLVLHYGLKATPIPTPIPGKSNISVVSTFYGTNTETGETLLEGTTSESSTVTNGTDKTINIPLSAVYKGHNYTASTAGIDGNCGLTLTEGGNGYVASGKVTASGTINVSYTRTYTPEPHVCEYGPWISTDPVIHWKECEECGAKAEEGNHVWESSAPDATGQVTRTCTVCGRTDSVHQHNWIGWYPTYYWGIQLDENEWHWKTCSFCDLLGPRGPHIAGEPVQEGGYMITRCTVCDWIMGKEPIMVKLTLHPNGGEFPDGTTQEKTFEIQFDALSDKGNISPDYIPTHPTAGEFQGFYIITPYFEGVFYNQKGIAGSQYFKNNGDGTYTSRLEEDYIVYAQYRQGEHVVTYNPNGAENGIMFPTYFELNVPKALSPNGFADEINITYDTGGVDAVVHSTLANTKIGWTFLGWGETETAGADYSNGQILTFTQSGSTELFAKWSYGTITLPNASATNNGMKLAGWQKEDGTVISVLDAYGNFKDTSYTLTGKDEVFTAVWTPNTYVVTFECANGTSHHTAKEVTYKQPYGTLPMCDVYGYDFLGWKMKNTGVDIVAQSIVTTAGNHTLVAQYNPKEITIKLDYNFNYDTAISVYKKKSSLSAIDWQTDTFTIKFGSAVGTLPTPEMEGYTFAGWYTEESGNNGCGENAHMVQAGTTPTSVTTYTYYARWTKDEYRVDLDYNRDYSVWE